ncbi:MAG: neutral/alkaline non-lysosomal ceramidase N-terminal domain-containing protein [Planctomycetaceae bacterium]|nr:neutral/alkaline non-lysosomal ceramidase N-terminal domain-containing protein [Planctomycetaceae bacterium]
MWFVRSCFCLVVLLLGSSSPLFAESNWQAGFAKGDITPTEPLRLSGYGSRTKPSEGGQTKLNVRCAVLQQAGDSSPNAAHVILSVDTIGFPAALTQEILEGVQEKHSVARSHFVICCTHSHTTPHIARGLENLFSEPVTEEEQAALLRYTDQVRAACVEVVSDAFDDLKPARIFRTVGEVGFAQNRRVIEDGVWKGFGVNERGPTDHSLPVLKVTDESGDQLRGILFNYACHCTTFGGEHNLVNGDWAGYASNGIETAHPGVVALCCIGCGADQNPPRERDKALEYAKAEGEEITEEVDALLAKNWTEVGGLTTSHFGFAGLPIDRPPLDEMRKALESPRRQVRHHAEVMLETQARMGRLPESYPMPIHVWKFDDEFSMVFLGGEVCVEYAQRIKKELGENVWVSAYSNDVFAYVAPERMRAEGGYEVDFSMIYYLQPGRWSSGTEDVILRRIHELHEGRNLGDATSAVDSLKRIQVPAGFRVELIASEPLITDPINFAFGADGKLWVVEMGDYPRGIDRGRPPADGRKHPWDGTPGGRIKFLEDTSGDGQFDKATVFAEGLAFPTGVTPWRDGVLVSGAPDLLFLKDSDGDGRADVQEVVFSGFEESNPQHRINGFEYGLDGALYLASGVASGNVTSTRTGKTVNMSGRDLKVWPDIGLAEPISGRSQYGRSRDDFGNWFGNTNSEPLFHYIMEDSDLKRNPFVASPGTRLFLTEPRQAPPVYPTSRTLDRFNDLYAANRFTSACSPFVYRDSGAVNGDLYGDVFICEPVHNLVSRRKVAFPGVEPTATRAEGEAESEFLTSTDPWFRPVRLMNAPDGSILVCDIYRSVIEHPEWIPEAWQARLDLYAGNDMGRIYRVCREDSAGLKVPNLAAMTDVELVDQLAHANGWSRDTAQRLLLERRVSTDSPAYKRLLELLNSEVNIACRIQELWTAHLLDSEFHRSAAWREKILRSDAAELVRQGVRIFDLEHEPTLKWQPLMLTSHPDERVRFELALRAGDCSPDLQFEILSRLAKQDAGHPWIRQAILTSSVNVAGQLLIGVAESDNQVAGHIELLSDLIATALGDGKPEKLQVLVSFIAESYNSHPHDGTLRLLGRLLAEVDRRRLDWASVAGGETAESVPLAKQLRPLFRRAREVVASDETSVESREAMFILLGREASQMKYDVALLQQYLSVLAPPELQIAAVETMSRLNEHDLLVQSLRNLGPQAQNVVQTTLLENQTGTKALLASLEQGTIETSDLSATIRNALLELSNQELRQRAAKLITQRPVTNRQQVVDEYAGVGELTGDVVRGVKVFKERCATCHRHQDLGVDLGPKLAALQDKSTEFLLVAILDPNRAVDSRYRTWVAARTDGRQISGLLIEETTTSLTFALSDGRRETVLRREIEEVAVSTRSFMPEGLEKDVSPQDVADVMQFIRTDAP